jgi:hypothetical protein
VPTIDDRAAPDRDAAGDRSSRFVGLSRARAALVLSTLLALSGWFVGAVVATPSNAARSDATTANASKSNAPAAATASVPAGGYHDSALYRAIIDRVHAGEGYYDAAGTELRARNYPTRPVFNWREPTYAWLLGHLPWPNVWLVALGLGTLVLSFSWIRHDWGERPALAVVMLHAGALPFGPEPVVFQEVWAGSLIILSATLYARGRWQLGMLTALAALAFREQALLPCGVAVVLALHERRWAEVRGWVVSLAAWAGLMALHFHTVERHLGPSDFAIPSRSWLVFGGPRFLVAMLGFDAYATFLPTVVVALVIPMALFGYAGWRNAGATRMGLTLLGFMLAFSIVGKPFDTYWGSLFVPLLSVGLVRFPFAARDLWVALRRTPAV